MGIPGLLKHINSVCTKENIYHVCRGKVLGIDGHAWLHSLAYSSTQSIVVDKNFGPLAQAFLQQCFMLQGHGVEPIFVFDGAPTPAKQVMDQGRQARRAKAIAQLHLDQDPDPKTLRAAVSLGWPAVEAVVRLLRQHGIPYIVALYEADAQLALLCRQGLIWAAATVDSDFIVHGLRNIFFKVNWRSGRCHFYSREVLEDPTLWAAATSQCSDLMELVKEGGLEVLLCFGLLVGCDYGTKIKGVGPKLSVALLEEMVRSSGGVWVLQDAFKMVDALDPLVMSLTSVVDTHDPEEPEGASKELRQQCRGLVRRGWEDQEPIWKQKARDAIKVFRNALAYDPTTKQVITASGTHNSIALMESPFLGEAEIPDEIAEARSLGLLSTSNQPVQLPPVARVRTASMDVALTEDMIEGATLQPLPWPAGYHPTIEQMTQWMRTRHMPMMSSERPNGQTYARVVQEKLQDEERQRARGEPIRLRDPSGRSLVSHRQRRPNESWTFAADSSRDYEVPTTGWNYDLNYIKLRAPAVDMSLIKHHWEHRLFGAGVEGSRTILDDAFGRVKEIPRLTTFTMHESPLQANPELGRSETSVLFKFSCPASYRQKTVYHVWTEARVSSLPGFHPITAFQDLGYSATLVRSYPAFSGTSHNAGTAPGRV